MPGCEPAKPKVPEWEYLLAHHPPKRYHRTLAVAFGVRSVHLCARCTGQGLGFIALLVPLLADAALRSAVFTPAVQIAVALLPLPAALDWATQSIGRRESRNGIRLVSGFALGVAFADLLGLLIALQWWFLLGAIATLGGYLFALLLTLRLTGAWRRVLQEHFPDLEALPSR